MVRLRRSLAIATRRATHVGLAIASVASVSLAFDPAHAQDDPVYFGGSLITTGIQASLDQPTLRGAKLAVKALNEQGGVLGREVKFRNLDGKSDPATVRNNAVQLIQDGADFIVAPCDFDFGGSAQRVAQQNSIVGMSTCGSSPKHGSATLGDKQFTMAMWNTVMGSAAAEYAYNEKGWDNAYVVTDTFIDYTTTLSKYFAEHFETLGGNIIHESEYTQGSGDFSAQLSTMKDKLEGEELDVIFISSYQPDLSMIIRTIRQAGIDAPIVGGDSYDDPGLWDALGKQFGNDIYFATHSYMKEGVAPGMADFLKRYEEEYGERPKTSFVATGWDTVMSMARAAEMAGTTDGEAVATALEENDFELLTGTMDWTSADTGHQPLKSVAMVELQDAKTEFIGWRTPSNVPTPPYLKEWMERQE